MLEYMFEMLSCLVSLICFGDVNRSTAIYIFSFAQKKHACTSVCTMSCPYVSKRTHKKLRERCFEAKCLNKSTAVPTPPLVVNDVFIYYLL